MLVPQNNFALGIWRRSTLTIQQQNDDALSIREYFQACLQFFVKLIHGLADLIEEALGT